MMPMPPALETAEASRERAIHPIGACTIGYSTPRSSVMRFLIGMRSPYSSGPEHLSAARTGLQAAITPLGMRAV